MESWKTLLHATHIRNNQRILEVWKEHDGTDVPFVQYHRKCRSVFTVKRDFKENKEIRIQGKGFTWSPGDLQSDGAIADMQKQSSRGVL